MLLLKAPLRFASVIWYWLVFRDFHVHSRFWIICLSIFNQHEIWCFYSLNKWNQTIASFLTYSSILNSIECHKFWAHCNTNWMKSNNHLHQLWSYGHFNITLFLPFVVSSWTQPLWHLHISWPRKVGISIKKFDDLSPHNRPIAPRVFYMVFGGCKIRESHIIVLIVLMIILPIGFQLLQALWGSKVVALYTILFSSASTMFGSNIVQMTAINLSHFNTRHHKSNWVLKKHGGRNESTVAYNLGFNFIWKVTFGILQMC